jgi:hypothetical protein
MVQDGLTPEKSISLARELQSSVPVLESFDRTPCPSQYFEPETVHQEFRVEAEHYRIDRPTT